APAIDARALDETLQALNDRLDVGAASTLDPKFVEQAADLVAERLERRDGPDALQADASPKSALDQHMVGDLIAELNATLRTLQSQPASDASPKSELDQNMVADLIAELDATRRTL